MQFPARRTSLLVSFVLLAAASIGGAGADGVEGDLENLTPVYSHDLGGGGTTGLGTDTEFFTSTVPLRDEAGVVQTDSNGDPIRVERDFAVVGSETRGAFVYDVTDPEAISFVKQVVCNQEQNDVQLKRFGARWVLVLTQDEAGLPCVKGASTPRYGIAAGGVALFDVTDPVAYKPLYSFGVAGGAHNFTWHPTRPYGWVSTGDLPGGRNHLPIIDFSDLETSDTTDKPKVVADIQSVGGPHDLSFNAAGTRAYVASENNIRIYDTTNPAAPVLLSATPTTGTYAHTAEVTPDGSTLVVTQESLALGGFFVAGTAVCPGEGLFFYDIAGALENAPVPIGTFRASVTGPVGTEDARACTAHQYRIAPNGHTLVVGWYAGGIRVVDFANPALPIELGHAIMPGAEVWSARTFKGPYVYSGDFVRGFDVFRWSGPGTAPWLIGS